MEELNNEINGKKIKYFGGPPDLDEPRQRCQKHGEYGKVTLHLVVDHKKYEYPYCPFCWGESMERSFPVEPIK